MERRLDRLAIRYQRERPAERVVYDVSALAPREQLECDLLLAEVERAERRTGVPSVALLTPAQRARLDTLLARVREA
jgi:hypothetical protein